MRRRSDHFYFSDIWDHVVCRTSNYRDPLQFKRLVKSIVIDERFIVQEKKCRKLQPTLSVIQVHSITPDKCLF